MAGNYHRVHELSEMAKAKGLKTKVGFTFRYAPATQYMFDLVREGKIGTPWLFNGYEQNSQWLNPWYPQDKRIFKEYPSDLPLVGTDPNPRKIEVASLEGYGAPTIDIGLELIGMAGDDIEKLVCQMANLLHERRRYNVDDHLETINWDDADMWIARTKKGNLFSMQTSFVTAGNYPGITAIIYGDKGALKTTLVNDPETGVIQTLEYADGWADPQADAAAVKYRQLDIPESYWGPGHLPDDIDNAYFSNLIRDFCKEILYDGEKNDGNFEQAARVQELINAAVLSHREERWVYLPLEG